MSRFKNMSRGGYIVVGIVAALILVPTGIAAATVAYTGIEGNNGATGTVNHADVTSAGQLLTTEANPNTFVQTADVDVYNGGRFQGNREPEDQRCPHRHNDSLRCVCRPHPRKWSERGAGRFETGSTCTGGLAGRGVLLNRGSDGETDLPLSPGLVVAKGDSLCGAAGGSVDAEVDVSGYTVSSTDAPTASAHPLAVPGQK